MKKLIFTVLFCVLSVASLHAQIPYAPGGVNYGSGMIVKETWGAGAPSPLTCSGFVRYWQTDATSPASPMWQCNQQTGQMVNLNASSGGASFAVTTTAATLQTMSGPLLATYFALGNTDTNIFRCGAKCFGIGSASGAADGSIKAASYTGASNGLLNPTIFSGSDIGAKVNAAFASCTDSVPCHVVVPPGVYSYSTPILLPRMTGGIELTIDRGAVLTYTGTGDAIGTQPMVNGVYNTGGTLVDGGGTVAGSSSGNSGLHIRPTQGVTVRDLTFRGFTNGYGIWVDGANVVTIVGNTASGNLKGLVVSGNMCNASNLCNWDINSSHVWANANVAGASGYAPNAVHAYSNRIVNNAQWGIEDDLVNGGSVTAAFGNSYRDNDLEGNGTSGSSYGSAISAFSKGTVFESNYLEGSPRGIVLGCVTGDAGAAAPSGYTAQFCGTATKTIVRSNFFNDPSTTDEVLLKFANGPSVEDNVVNGNAQCLVDLSTAIGNISIYNNQILGTGVETCQGGTPGGDLANYTINSDVTNHRLWFRGNVNVAGTLTTPSLDATVAKFDNNVISDGGASVSLSALNTAVDLPGTSALGNAAMVMLLDSGSHAYGLFMTYKSLGATQIGGNMTAGQYVIGWNNTSNALTVTKTSGTVPATIHYFAIMFGS